MDELSSEQSAKPLPRCVLLVEDNGLLAMNIQEMLIELGRRGNIAGHVSRAVASLR